MSQKGKFADIINSETPVLVDFYADWCGPCQTMAPILKEVKSELGDKAKVIKIDTDKNQMLAAQYQIRSIPTLILFQNGEVKWRQSGVIPAGAIAQVVESHLN